MIGLHKSYLLACVLGLGLGAAACSSEDAGDSKPFGGSVDPAGNGTAGQNGNATGDQNGNGSANNGGTPDAGGKGNTGGLDAGDTNASSGQNGNDAGNATAGQNGDDAGSVSGGEDAGAGATGAIVETGEPKLPPLAASCEGKVKPGVMGPLPTFARQTLSTQAGAAYMHPADVNKDGFDEYLLTSLSVGVDLFSPTQPPLDWGAAYVLSRNGGPAKGTIGTWSTKMVFDQTKKIGCPNSSEMFDVDGDGVKDWMIGAGFLIKPESNIVWMKGSANGTFGAPQKLTVPDAKCWYHITLPLDIDGDRDNDFITSCHVGDVNNVNGASRVEWFENDGKGKFKSHKIGDGGGSLLSLYDLDADGDLDVIAPQFFGPEAMVWYEQTGEKGTAWTEHLINNTTGRGFIVKFADMNGDGKVDMLYGNHNNEEAAAPNKVMGIYWFDLPAASEVRGLTNWDAYKHTIYEGFQVFGTDNADSAGSPGMINVGDIDGDCDMDVTASGDGDTGLYLFVQQANGFARVNLYTDDSNQNSGEQHLADLDGDGDQDIIWAVFGPSGAGQILGLNSHVYGFLQD